MGHGEALTLQCVGPELGARGVVQYSVPLQGCFSGYVFHVILATRVTFVFRVLIPVNP